MEDGMFLSKGVAEVGFVEIIITIFSFTLLFGDKLHRASYCHNKLLTLYSVHLALPHCPVCDKVTRV